MSPDAGVAHLGSSPLARGLLKEKVAGIRQNRIIPARAGFTVERRTVMKFRTDHPRSRGVYALATLKESGVEGSSPLARGLPIWRRDAHHG